MINLKVFKTYLYGSPGSASCTQLDLLANKPYLRVSKLPLGVECTLYLLQAILEDKSDSSSHVSDIEMQLLYSTSIIR